jgi:PKD repeat protein
VGESVLFDGSDSQDNDAEGSDAQIVRYFWSFGDGATQTTTSPTTSHPYAAAGTYQATLTVTDNDGEAASTDLLIEVDSPPPPGAHEATGGGHILVGGQRANFGFDADSSATGTSGHLTYQDKAGGVKVQSRSITSLQVSGNQATIRGSCTVNKVSGFTFTVDVVDDGPGPTDVFRIRLSNGYEAGGTLGGGNIEVE